MKPHFATFPLIIHSEGFCFEASEILDTKAGDIIR